ncbi:amino acid adenylation domain-containing protein [Streptomyces sp. NPDC048290]|uniref:amino acid adenylation domain-containing protein n=1 Tax=Streptomyces sp. NPDC048290 TaxID=3155811 RepID=UPI00344071E3
MSDLLSRLASLSGAERARVMERLRQGSGGSPPTSPDTPAPLTDAEQRLWVLQSLSPGSPAHHLSAALYLDGPLDVPALGRALTELTARHPALRSVFREEDGAPLRRVLPPGPVAPRLVDLGGLPVASREPSARGLHREDARRPFDLAAAPPVRHTLYRLAPRRHVLTVVAHHLICDGRSFDIFTTELAALYEAFSTGRPCPLAPVPSVDVRATPADLPADRERHTRALAHWRQALAGVLPVLDLPIDRPRPAEQRGLGARHGFRLPAELYRELHTAAARGRSTVYGALLAAYAVALHRITGQDDFVIGAPVDTRRVPAQERRIGFFVNTLPLRVRLPAGRTFAEVTARVGEVLRESLEHDVPFGEIVRETGPLRLPGRTVLRQTAFSYEPTVASAPGVRELTLTPAGPADFDPGVSPLDLALHVREQDGELLGFLEYRTDLFDAETVARWAAVFEEAVRETARSPEAVAVAPEPETQLTDSQLALYFGRQTTPGVRLYYAHVTALYSLDAPLDHARFQRAFQKLVDHSDALRSTFHDRGGVPVRRVARTLPAPVALVDLSDEPDPRATALAWARERTEAGLDPARRVFDSALLRLGESAFVWYLDIDHSVADAWSMSLILRTVSHYYDLDGLGSLDRAAPLPPFRAYVDHERAQRGSERGRRAERHWRETLDRPAERLAFYGREETVAGTTRTARTSVGLDERLSSRIAEFVRREGHTSAATVFGAALFAYLFRVGGGEILRVGTPFANRTAAFRDTVGLFMNVLPLQVRADGEMTLRDLARQTQRAFLEAARHQEHPPRRRAGARPYDVYLNYQNVAFHGFGGVVGFELVDSGHSPDRLTLQVRDLRVAPDAPPRFVLDFDFNTACFDARQRERTTGHYLRLLEALLEQGGERLGDAPLLSPEELRELDSFNDTVRPYDLDVPLHVLVERQVRRTPDAPAVVFEGQILTYAELGMRADRLAERIRRVLGPDAVPGAAVAVHLDRGPDLVVALLGVLKAGCAYLPVDPSTPPERMAFMVADADVELVLTARSLPHGVLHRGVAVLSPSVPQDRDLRVHEDPVAAAVPSVDRDQLAYLIYTSGSTGTPKCVTLTHRAVCNRLLWMQDTYGLGPSDAVLQKTPFTFDVSVWEFFWPLMTGARLVVARPEGHRDPGYLAEVVERESVTTVHFVPSMLRVFLDDPAAGGCRSLRQVMASGEALPPDLVGRFFTVFPPPTVALHNLYGPTEAAIDVSAWECRPADATGPVPIGHPVANTTLDVLDDRLALLPSGVTGELHIGGAQLATGYRGREELTAERFVPDPRRPGGRLYRTGDLVRRRTDGALEYLGRADGQVKVRGHRVELGEIETRLAGHTAVRAAAVRLWADRLVAYAVPAAGAALPDVAELRAFLARSLPDHMVPTAVLPLAALPVTANGKLDRSQLPPPGQASGPAPDQAPRTPRERAVTSLWAGLLGRAPDEIGLDDDFFAVGGHSLLAARLIAETTRRFGVRLPLASLFQAPTVRGFAALLAQGPRSSLLLPLRSAVVAAPLFLLHPAGGDVMAYRELVTALPPGREVLAVRSRALHGEQEFGTLREMALWYAELVAERQPDGPYLLAGWSMGGVLAVEVAAVLESRGARVGLVALLDSSVPGPADPDPLLAPAIALADVLADTAVTADDATTLRDRLRGLPLEERLKLLTTWAEEHGLSGADEAAASEALLTQARLAEQHERLVLEHRPPVVDAPLTVWWAREKLHARRTGWAHHTRAGVREEATLPGNHFTVLRPPHVAGVAALLATALDTAERSSE